MSERDRQKWNARYAAGSHVSDAVSPFLASLEPTLPTKGRALDVAGGAGRNGLWLAERGLEVTVTDISRVGLALAADRARERGLPLETEERDLAEHGLPAGPWDLVVSVLYLERKLLAELPEVLAPNGAFVMLQPTVTNLERHAKPPRAFLLEPGELRTLLPSRLEVIRLEESWSEDGFHEARLHAQLR